MPTERRVSRTDVDGGRGGRSGKRRGDTQRHRGGLDGRLDLQDGGHSSRAAARRPRGLRLARPTAADGQGQGPLQEQRSDGEDR